MINMSVTCEILRFLSKLCQIFILRFIFVRQQKLSKKLAWAIGRDRGKRPAWEVNLIVRLYIMVISHDLCTNEWED